jgi:signal transduction histidine kinase
MLNTPMHPPEELRRSDTLFNISNCILHCIDKSKTTTDSQRFICMFDPPIKLIQGDEEQIARVISVFISNAIKYSGKTKMIEIRTSAENGKMKMSVTDHGVGINAVKLKSIFKSANQEASSNTRLQTAARIIEHHNGQIGAESYVDIGSTFWFTLPL